jgi:hypothetical protein
MHEPLETVKCKKCGKIITEQKELIKFRKVTKMDRLWILGFAISITAIIWLGSLLYAMKTNVVSPSSWTEVTLSLVGCLLIAFGCIVLVISGIRRYHQTSDSKA